MESQNLTQTTIGSTSDIEYFWVAIFKWEVNNPNPFQVVVRDVFGEDEIPISWFTMKLTTGKRHKKKCYKSFKCKEISIFCKLQKGKILIIIIKLNILIIYNLNLKACRPQNVNGWKIC